MLAADGVSLEEVFSGVLSADRPIAHGAWTEAVTAIRAGVREGRTAFVLNGDRAVGKTTLARWIEREYGDAIEAVPVGEAFRRPVDKTPIPVFIRSLEPSEMSSFLAESLRRWDFPPEMLTPRAARRIVRLAGGKVGDARTLLLDATSRAAGRGARRVRARHIGSPVPDPTARPPGRSRALPRAMAVAATAGALALLGAAAALLVAFLAPGLLPTPSRHVTAVAERRTAPPLALAEPPAAAPSSPITPPPAVSPLAASPPAVSPPAASPPAASPNVAPQAATLPLVAAVPMPVAPGPVAPVPQTSPAPTPSMPPTTLRRAAIATAPPAPASAPLTVVIRFDPNRLAARLDADALARQLAARGITVASLEGDAYAARRSSLSYAYDEDRAAAFRLRDALGPRFDAVMPTFHPASQMPGRIDIVLAGQER